MIRRLAPFLTVVLLTAGLYLIFEHRRTNVRTPVAPGAPAASSTATRPVQSRPESGPELIAAVPYAEPVTESRAESAPASAPYKPVVVFELVREDERPIA